MKKLLFIVFIFSYSIGFSQLDKRLSYLNSTKFNVAVCRVEADSSIVMDAMPFHTKFEHKNIAKPKFTYSEAGKNISFTPLGMKWMYSETAVISKKPKVNFHNNESEYLGVFDGISIENIVSKNGWRKIIKIDSLSMLGSIPDNAEYLEFIFEVQNSFNLTNANKEIWDKSSDFYFSKQVNLTALSRIKTIQAWDSDTIVDCKGLFYTYGNKTYMMKQIPVSFLKIAKYPVYTDVTISYGSEYTYNSATTTISDIDKLSETSAIVAYTNGSTIYTKVATVSNSTEVGYGTVQSFALSGTEDIKVSALSSTSFIIVYKISSAIYAKVGTISGTDITLGDQYTIQSVGGHTDYGAGSIGVSTLSSSLAVICWRAYYSDDGEIYTSFYKIETLNISTRTITPENSWDIDEPNIGAPSAITGLSSTTFALITETSSGRAKVNYCNTTSGVLSTAGNELGSSINVCKISSTSFAYCYTNSSSLSVLIGTVSGTTVSVNSPTVFDSSVNSGLPDISSPDANLIIVSYVDAAGSGYAGVNKLGTISGSSVTVGDPFIFNNASTSNTSVTALSTTSVINSFTDVGNSSYGKTIVGNIISATGKKWNGITISKWNGTTISKLNTI